MSALVTPLSARSSGTATATAEIDPATAERRRQLAAARALLLGIDRLVKLLVIHDRDNKAVGTVLDDLGEAIGTLGEDGRDLVVIFAEGHPFVKGSWIRVRKLVWEATVSLTERLLELGARGFVLSPSVTRDGLVELALRLDPRGADDRDALAHEIASMSDVRLVSARPVEADDEERPSRLRALVAFEDAVQAVEASHEGDRELYLRRHKRALVQQLVEILEDEAEDLLTLTAVRDLARRRAVRDLLVCIYALALGCASGLSRRQLVRLGMAILDPAVSARCTGDAGAEEMSAVAAARAVLGSGPLTPELALRAVLCLEGRSPAQEDADLAPLLSSRSFARILAVAARFDALTTPRADRGAYLPHDAVRVLLRDAERERLDPFLVRTFLRVVGRFPPGSVVELDGGEVAVVLGRGLGLEPLARPRVLVVSDGDGTPLPRPVERDLGERDPEIPVWSRSVVRALDPAELELDPVLALFAERAPVEPALLDRDDPRLDDGRPADPEA